MDAFLSSSASAAAKRVAVKKQSKPVATASVKEASPLHSEIPDVSAFYAQLSDSERIAHTIAVEKLGTSYDVTRTHGYLKWLKTVKTHQ